MAGRNGEDPKIGMIGCGYWGRNLVRNFCELGVLVGVCDATEGGRSAAKKIAPNVATMADVAELLAMPIAGVGIATPAETHFDLVRQALCAGKDVFVEKPMALTAEQGAALVELARNRQRILMVGHVMEYHPAIIKITDLVHDGVLGKVQYIYSNRLSLGKVRREENILWSFAPHDVAIILRLMGSMPFQVVACGGSYVQPNIADVTLTSLLFDNGVRAHIHVSWLHPFKEHRLVVIGQQKMATYDDVSKKLLVYDQRVEVREGEPIPVKGDGQEVPFDAAEPLKRECEAYLVAVKTRSAPVTEGASGLRVLKVLQAAQRSLVMNGQPVNLPIETWNGAGVAW